MAKTTTISIRVEPELKAILEIIAAGSGFSVADTVKAALRDYIKRYEDERGVIPQRKITRRAAEIIARQGQRRRF